MGEVLVQKTTKYHPPPPRKEKKTFRPKSTHNPLGDIAIHERWSTAEKPYLPSYALKGVSRKKVYLAAYLACWLCVFVLPSKDVNSIRPSTFKMASLMANGRRVNLAIPVLASIYEGLNTVATSPKPDDEPFKFVDDGRAEELDHSYFVAIRSSYLTLRQGGRFIIEPYSPHRFRRQFGPKSIKITLKRKKDENKHGWRTIHPHALIPPIVIECDSQAAIVEATKGKCSSHNVADSNSSNKDRHWKRQRKEAMPLKAIETNENASRSLLANFVVELEDEVQSIDVGEESETSHSSTMTHPLGMGLRRKTIFTSCCGVTRSLSSEKLPQSLHEQQLKEVKARLQDVQAKASEEASEIQSAMDELEHVEEDIAILKGRRTNLRATLKEKKQLNHVTQAKVREVEKDLAALESTDPLDDVIVQNLESSRANLGILTEDLKSLNPFA
ncbi:UNVERIFIED_CONTAM: hypothetical protein Sradi_6545100 [Sesamum radiatum]|uniref:Aminotransferase-like plant mobile domain-containing protein n=1 Tax=Sesamum radiatum TaxID=300843 RepID=A0AAW2JYR7_SESRA